MIFKPKRNEFKKKKKKPQKYMLFSFDPNTTKQREIVWIMNQTHNQWNSNTTHRLSLMKP